MSMKRGE
jgi:sugar phosphate permease